MRFARSAESLFSPAVVPEIEILSRDTPLSEALEADEPPPPTEGVFTSAGREIRESRCSLIAFLFLEVRQLSDPAAGERPFQSAESSLM